jgi:hypothetical protein
MVMEYGARINADQSEQLITNLSGYLTPDEVIWMILKSSAVMPMVDRIVVTNARVMSIWSSDDSEPYRL